MTYGILVILDLFIDFEHEDKIPLSLAEGQGTVIFTSDRRLRVFLLVPPPASPISRKLMAKRGRRRSIRGGEETLCTRPLPSFPLLLSPLSQHVEEEEKRDGSKRGKEKKGRSRKIWSEFCQFLI